MKIWSNITISWRYSNIRVLFVGVSGIMWCMLTSFHDVSQEHILPKPRPYYRVDQSAEPDVWLEAVQVWEVKCADLSLSPVYKAAMGLVSAPRVFETSWVSDFLLIWSMCLGGHVVILSLAIRWTQRKGFHSVSQDSSGSEMTKSQKMQPREHRYGKPSNSCRKWKTDEPSFQCT